MKNRSYKRGGDIATTIGIKEEDSLMDKVANGVSSLKDKVVGLFSGGGKTKRVRFSMKKRKSIKRSRSKRSRSKRSRSKRSRSKRSRSKRKTNKRKSSKRN
jgi:arginine/serine-rich splicing factor 12